MSKDDLIIKEDEAGRLRTLGKFEIGLIWPYLYRGSLTSKFPMVVVDFDGKWQSCLPLLVCAEKDFGYLCIFHSDFWLVFDNEYEQLQFDIGVHRYISNEFQVICTNIDESHSGFCYISYGLVAICQRQAIIDILFKA